MDIVYPAPYCELGPTNTHYYKNISGDIWRCKHCWRTMWLPHGWYEAKAFEESKHKLGMNIAYARALQRKPKTKQLLTRLEEVRTMREIMPKDELVRIVAVIFSTPSLEEDKDLVMSKVYAYEEFA